MVTWVPGDGLEMRGREREVIRMFPRSLGPNNSTGGDGNTQKDTAGRGKD